MSTYLVSYSYGGHDYVFEIIADSWDEAESRVNAIKYTAEVFGSDAVRIPVAPSWISRLFGLNG
jgi:hypothetical protein